LAWAAAGAWAAVEIPGDAAAGQAIFREQNCITCHSVSGEGGKSAPDLGRRVGRSYTPDLMASLMWNHAPAMWSAMERASISRPQLTIQQAADLFAFFYAARYFEKPGDAARGKQLFLSKRCADCHHISSSGGGGPPVVSWESLADPIGLAQQMWNHRAGMAKAFSEKKVAWPTLTGQELTDILVYLQNLPQTKALKPAFTMASSETGQRLLEVKGCLKCHQGANFLSGRFVNRSLAQFAAEMWNHGSHMTSALELRPEEMRRIAGYLWSVQYFDAPGSADRGRKMFGEKKCSTCHDDRASGAPTLTGGGYNSFGMVTALWRHGPGMLARMREKRIDWPQFRQAEMSHLIAYLNSRK
jgi:mono/diheme cytochrome c family protein